MCGVCGVCMCGVCGVCMCGVCVVYVWCVWCMCGVYVWCGVWCVCGLCMHVWVTCKGGTIMEALQIHYTESGLNPNSWWAAGGQLVGSLKPSLWQLNIHCTNLVPSPYGYQLGNIICCSKYVQLSGFAGCFVQY